MDSLLADVNLILGQYTNNINSTVSAVINTTAQDAKNSVKLHSPKRTGRYAKGWSVKKANGRAVIYNKEYRLTHLLENGHDVVVNGKKVGHSPAHPHIKPVEEWVQAELPERMKEALGNVD